MVSNQFGTDQEWVVKAPVYLLLPAQKLQPLHPPPSGLDHYLCYDVISGPPAGVDDVTLTDQFYQEFNVTVGDPMVFCNPVDKIVPDDGLPIYDNENHLACYDAQTGPPPSIIDSIAFDQFDDYSEFVILSTQFLCVPSTKKIKPSGSCSP